ncbi:hypothetical protein ACFE04_021882 [Oxalis oulophora]
MKRCELCSHGARMFCESDQASLCWTCDEKIHAANFLVAKHTRTLLCHLCHAPTTWTASGPKLTPTLSVCDTCVDTHNEKQHEEEISNEDEEESEESDDEFTDEEEEDVENQVVPWTMEASVAVPTPMSSSTSEERGTYRRGTRLLDSDEEVECCFSHAESSRSTDIINSLKRFQNQRMMTNNNDQQASRTIIRMCNLTRDF